MDFAAAVTGRTGELRMPVGAFLVEHPSGLVLFDSGMHPDLVTSTERLGPLGAGLTIELDEAELVGARLAAVGVDPREIAVVVTSHLHFDHCGGHAQLPNARIVVQRAEWEAARNERLIAAGIYNPGDFDLGHDIQLVDGPQDLFGDGTLRLVPTIGHTPGHQSLVIDDHSVLVGDACYCQLALDEDALPAFAWDRAQQLATFAWLRQQQADGRELLFAHDQANWPAPTGVPSGTE